MKIEITYQVNEYIWICHILPTIRCCSERDNNYFEVCFAWLFWRIRFRTK